MKLHRPYIPLSVRVLVAHRQLVEAGAWGKIHVAIMDGSPTPLSIQLEHATRLLFGDKAFALDHHPALVNRKQYARGGKVFYQPPANDPEHLRYRESGPGSDHDIKTRVRGDGAQRSDLGQRRYNKRVARNRERVPPGKASRFPKRPAEVKPGTDKSRPKRKWPKRSFK